MTSDERRASLADDAAAWVPPWARTPEPRPAASLAGEDPPATEPAPDETPVDQPLVEQPPVTETPEDEVPTGETPDGGALPPPAEPDPGAPVDVPATETPERPDSEVPSPDTEIPQVEAPAEANWSPEAVSPEAVSPAAGTADLAAPEAAPQWLDDDRLRGALEAILLVVDQPVTEVVLAQVLEQPTDRVAAALERIASGYTEAGHGFELRRAAGGWRLYTRPEYADYVERYVLDGQSVRLTQAALETLAVVAYKQPVTRSRISAIRGVNCDGVIRTLVSRGLVEECGTEPESGAFLYRTSTLFLEKLGLDSVDQLPPLAPFLPDDVEDLTDAPR
ncbi:MAG TPA: SMC-Scp complex subunit ScpB [Micromonosporaceae bacterium]